MHTKEMLQQQLQDMGILPTDTVLIHTSFKAVGDVEGGPNGFIDAFCEYLSAGRFIIPTQTWGVVHGEQPVFDVTKTLPNIGLIPRTAAFRPDGIRSLHPTHSVWIRAKDAEDLIKNEVKAMSPAPLGYFWSNLSELGTKILLIGVGHNRNTFIHGVEEVLNIRNRFKDDLWQLTRIDAAGNSVVYPFRQYGFDSSMYFNNFDRAMTETGAQQFGQIGDAEVRVVDAAKCAEIVTKVYLRADVDPCASDMTYPESWWR